MLTEGAAMCMRVAGGKAHAMSDGSVGHIHRLIGQPRPERPFVPDKPKPHMSTECCEDMLTKALSETQSSQLQSLSAQLGLKVSSLLELKVAFSKWNEKGDDGKSRSYAAWLFPMRDGNGSIVGFRARDWNGNKWSVRGSRNALFWPWVEPESDIWITEGATDTAALRQIGCFAVGRPSCSGGLNDLKMMTAKLGCRRAYILADNDKPGLDGAERLAQHLMMPCCIMCLPCKDVREGLNMGLNYGMLMALSNTAVWRTK